jgi:hypothetical protein
MRIVTQVADAMQDVLTETADIIGRETGFIQRQRKLSGSSFAQTLVLGWLSNPDATLEELAQTAATLGVVISPQGLDDRFTPQGADFLLQMLETGTKGVIANEPVAIDVLRRFNGVYIQDSSTIALPDALAVIYAGCGGSTAKNTSSALKIQIRLDLNTGKLAGPYLQPGKEHDRSSALEDMPLPTGALRIADLGYFSLKNFAHLNTEGVYWLSKVKSQCDVYDEDGKRWDLLKLLKKRCQDELDMEILLGAKERVPCRLLAVRVPDAVAKLRRSKLISEARREGKKVSKKTIELTKWTVMCGNIPRELLSLYEAIVLMRARWQIELLFKLWKSHGHVDEWRSEKPWRILCEVYAKLLAMLIQHWILIAGCWEYPNRSLFKAVKTIRRHAMNLVCAFASGSIERLHEALETIQRCLSVGCRINKRSAIPHTYQLLLALHDSS